MGTPDGLLRSLTTHSEAETVAVGRQLARTLPPGSIVLLYGDLGAGKTAFVRGLAAGLGISPDEVSSPTFTLVQEYRTGRLPLFHVDLYRLESIEVDDLGLDEMTLAGGITAVEWPDRLPRAFDGAIVVRIEHGGGDTRNLILHSPVTPIDSWALPS
jgi:tRNA threonylcarbamoyladenosine biosynthesis protein TsaE